MNLDNALKLLGNILLAIDSLINYIKYSRRSAIFSRNVHKRELLINKMMMQVSDVFHENKYRDADPNIMVKIYLCWNLLVGSYKHQNIYIPGESIFNSLHELRKVIDKKNSRIGLTAVLLSVIYDDFNDLVYRLYSPSSGTKRIYAINEERIEKFLKKTLLLLNENRA